MLSSFLLYSISNPLLFNSIAVTQFSTTSLLSALHVKDEIVTGSGLPVDAPIENEFPVPPVPPISVMLIPSLFTSGLVGEPVPLENVPPAFTLFFTKVRLLTSFTPSSPCELIFIDTVLVPRFQLLLCVMTHDILLFLSIVNTPSLNGVIAREP